MSGGGDHGHGGGGAGKYAAYAALAIFGVMAASYAVGAVDPLVHGKGLPPLIPSAGASNDAGSNGRRSSSNAPLPPRRNSDKQTSRRENAYPGTAQYYSGTQRVFRGSDRVFTGTTREYRGTVTTWNCDIAVNHQTGERRVIAGSC